MADAPTVHIGENTPGEVAHKQMSLIRRNQEKPTMGKDAILNLYAECLLAVRDPAGHLAGNHADLLQIK